MPVCVFLTKNRRAVPEPASVRACRASNKSFRLALDLTAWGQIDDRVFLKPGEAIWLAIAKSAAMIFVASA